MNELDKMKCKMQIKKAEASIAELEFKIVERLQDIERMKEHIKLQEEIKKEAQKKLEE